MLLPTQAIPSYINALAKLLVSHGLNDEYNIRVSQKYFNIADDEQVIGFRNEDMMVGAVCMNGQIPLKLLREHNIQPLANGVIGPSTTLAMAMLKRFYMNFLITSVAANDKPVSVPFIKDFSTDWSSLIDSLS
ncbi:hypothetical protein PENDEC_c004G02097 [Penicillium decumbens]|uniref:Uncharacterized protein n=1 Tax=Penicillium decumbens TaxID=69771 RepID=A0A1V6PJ71_PENDC|nr:hypothetical protein PENDEC_c004G02097 [Penicillium decumbens]